MYKSLIRFSSSHYSQWLSIITLHFSLGGKDYAHGPYYVTFAPRQTHALLTVNIHKDDELERREHFHLTIMKTSHLASHRISVHPEAGRARVIIIDSTGE